MAGKGGLKRLSLERKLRKLAIKGVMFKSIKYIFVFFLAGSGSADFEKERGILSMTCKRQKKIFRDVMRFVR